MHEELMTKLSTDFSTPISILKGKDTGWRCRAKLAVRGSIEKPKMGLFKPGTHEVEDLIDCPDHHPSINKALNILRSHKFHPYNETTHTGDLRYVQLITSRQTGKVQLVLVTNGKDKCQELAQQLQVAYDWHSIWINVQDKPTNTIFGPNWLHLYGPRYLEEELLGLPFYFHPACFIQAHLDLYEKILSDIKNLTATGHITELYAGVGAISRVIDRPATLIESNPYAQECFIESHPPTYLEYITGKSEDHAHHFKDILIVDPPRKGLDPKIIQETKDLKQILYLSCNPDSLKRDIEDLKKLGWKTQDVKGYELFPNTPHVEILVSLVQTIPKHLEESGI